jgi:hypothetical protein
MIVWVAFPWVFISIRGGGVAFLYIMPMYEYLANALCEWIEEPEILGVQRRSSAEKS